MLISSMLRFVVLVCALLLCASPVLAAELEVTPVVIDDKAKARDILKRSITVRNTTERKLNLFPSVNDVDAREGEEEFVSAQNADERADSLANWIELSRGVVELSPGEEKTIPFTVRITANAVPGTYHASISFGDGGDRASAEASTPLAVVAVNLDVQEDVKEFMQLKAFKTDSLFFSGDDVLFDYQLENIGNKDLKPTGEIRIYDRKGTEVASVEVNADGKEVPPSQISQLASVWSAAQGFGRYKAYLNVDYGSSQTASVQDTVFFWIVPWQQLLGLIVVSLIAVIVLALYSHRWLEARHHQKFALAHGIPVPSSAPPSVTPLPPTSPSAPVSQPPAPAPTPEPARSAPAPVANQIQSHTVDLSKRERVGEAPASSAGQVINLKRRA